MTGPLAFVGGPAFATPVDVETEVVAQAGADEVLLLPTGAAYEHPDRLATAATERFSAAGIAVRTLDVLTRASAVDPAHVDAVGGARAVYLAGPSPMHVRSVLKDTPVWDALVAAWEGGAALLTSGGGAMVVCDPMVDPRGGAFTVGMGLVRGVTVIPGLATWSEDAVHRTRALSPAELAIVGLGEGTAVVRAGDGTWTGGGEPGPQVYVGGAPATLADLGP